MEEVELEQQAAQAAQALSGLQLDVTFDFQDEAALQWAVGLISGICSWLVFRTVFCVAFQWYSVLTFMKQLSSVLSIESAVVDQLPCYIDLRRPGNLEGWFTARAYIDLYCDTHTLGLKNQAIVFSALIVSGVVSFNAISSSFSDASAVDWRNPSTLFSLLNMLVLGMLLFLCLVALERINREGVKLLKKLDMVGLEVSKVSNVEVSVEERTKVDQLQHGTEAVQRLEKEISKQEKDDSGGGMSPRAGGSPSTRGEDAGAHETQAMIRQAIKDLEGVAEGVGAVDSVLLEVHKIVQRITSHNEVGMEAAYLQNILAELRDQADMKKIFGIVIDRAVLSKMFGGVAAVVYLIVKETADQLLRKYSFAGAMLGQPEDIDDADRGSDEYCSSLNAIQEAALMTFRLANETCAYNISVGGLEV